MINGGLYILAANTGCGKTALALQIADAVANEDRSVLFISLEMDEYQLTARRLARAAKSLRKPPDYARSLRDGVCTYQAAAPNVEAKTLSL